jgi:hypothetical protein
MNRKVEINPEHIPLLRELYSNKINDLEIDLAKYRRLIKELDLLVHDNIRVPSLEEVIYGSNDYNNNWTIKRKLEFLLKDKELTTKELVQSAIDLGETAPRNVLVANFSAVFSTDTKKENGTFKRRKNERDEYIYSISTREKAINDLI